MTKQFKTIFEIFLQGVGLYFSNAGKFLKYMLYPVFGSLFGVIAIYYSIIFYDKNIVEWMSNFELLTSPLSKNILFLIVLAPALIIFLTSLWKYFVSYSAISSMTENLLKSDKLYDFPAHNQLVTRRWLPYLGLWLIYLIIATLTTLPIFWIIGVIALIYATFVFQIFIFEDNLTPIECFKKSSIYVQGHFLNISGLIILIGTLTYLIIPHIIYTLFEALKITPFLTDFISQGINLSSLYGINMMLSAIHQEPLTVLSVSQIILVLTIFKTTARMLLPLRIICIFLWYKNYCNDNDVVKKIDEKFLKRINKEANKKKRKK